MGGAVSHQAVTVHRKLLIRLAGPTAIEHSDTFWLRLGTFPVQLSSLDPEKVDQFLEDIIQQLVVNSRTTRNFQTFALRVTGTVGWSKEAGPLLLAANSITLLRYLMKGMLEKLPGPEFLLFLTESSLGPVNAKDHARDKSGILENLVESLVKVITGSDIEGNAYLVQLEAVRLLLTGCSTQLATPQVIGPEGSHPCLDALMSQTARATSMFQTLLTWFIKRPSVPLGLAVFTKGAPDKQGMLRYMANAAASVLWLPVTAYNMLVGTEWDVGQSPLADASQLLLMALVNHTVSAPQVNLYRQAMSGLHDEVNFGGIESSSPTGPVLGMFPSVSYGALYETIGKTLVDERSTLLLYQLLQSCLPFREYVLVRSDLETLIIPLLKLLYNVRHQNLSQYYLLSIILLILSQDTSFGRTSHKTMVSGLDWYKERPLGQTSLGSLLMIILLRTAHRNFSCMRDVYLHTNTIAAFTNFAGSAVGLHSHAAQRLLSLIEVLEKAYVKLSSQEIDLGSNPGDERHLQFLSDFLRILMEVTNGIITTNLPSNPELVYAILHRQHVLDALSPYPQFGDVLENLKAVPEFFNARIDEAKSLQPGVDWSVDRVLEVVHTSSRSWRTDRLRAFPELKFSYEEEQSPGEFFVPLVWSLIVAHSGIPWDLSKAALFTSTKMVAIACSDIDQMSVDTPVSRNVNNELETKSNAPEIHEIV